MQRLNLRNLRGVIVNEVKTDAKFEEKSNFSLENDMRNLLNF